MGRIRFVAILACATLALTSASQAADAAEASRDTVIYYQKAKGFWHIRLRTDVSGSGLAFIGDTQDGGYLDLTTRSDSRIKQNIGLGIGPVMLNAGFSLNGKKPDGEFAVTSFGKYLSFHMGYSYSRSLSGTGIMNRSTELNIPSGALFHNAFQARLCYAVNGKRFSFPAAMNQSYIQKRSAGSLLIGVNAMAMGASSKPDGGWTMSDLDLDNINIGVGLGYGYNLVPFERMLIHASLLVSPSVFNKTWISTGGPKESLTGSVSMSFLGNFAAVYHFRKSCYIGAFASFNDLITVGDFADYAFKHMKSEAHIAVGFRF